MIKRIFIFSVIVLALFYAGAGIYFYKKSSRKKITSIIPKPKEEVLNTADLIILREIFFDFENGQPVSIPSISNERSVSGKKSVKIIPESEYGCEIKKSFSEISSWKNLRRVEITLKIWTEKKFPDNLWVMEVDGEDGKVQSWGAEGLPVSERKWETTTMTFDIKKDFLKNFNQIKTYAWNRNKGTFYIDDIQIRFLGIQPEESSITFAPLNQSTFFYDLENESSMEGIKTLSTDVAHSGRYSSLIKSKNSYSVSIVKKAGDIINDTIRSVWASVWLYPLDDNSDCTLSLEIRNTDDEPVFWSGKSTAKMNLKANSWQKINGVMNLSAEDYRKLSPDDKLYVYVVNNKRTKIYVDDFKISFGDIPDRRGEQTFVDMNGVRGNYEFSRYNPPYKISNFIFTDIQNEQSTYLVKKDSLMLGELFPHQTILTGKFTDGSPAFDQLLVLTENEISIFSYCVGKKNFVLSGKTSFSGKGIPSNNILTGDLNGNGKQELIIASANTISIYEFKTDAGTCVNNFKEMKMNEISILNAPGFFKMLTGKFSGRNYDELFLIDTSGSYQLKNFTTNTWKTTLTDTLPNYMFSNKSVQVAGNFSSPSADQILTVYNYKGQTRYALLGFNEKKTVSTIVTDPQKANIFDWNAKLFRIRSVGYGKDRILSFSDHWRFEMKIIDTDNEGFFVSSVPEFKGYVSDRNPKYYEFPRIVPVLFSGNDFGILCVLYNCADKKFNGVYCKEYDSISDLPNSVQLYKFSR